MSVQPHARGKLSDVPIVVGGIVPPEDEVTLKKAGVAAVYTPKDFQDQPDHGGRGEDRGKGKRQVVA